MTQAEWDQRVFDRGDVWQYFRMADAAGLPQDSGEYGFCHMTGGAGSAYDLAGPFSGAKAITGSFTSPVYAPSPALDANYGHPKTWEGWAKFPAAPAVDGSTILACGTLAIVMNANRKLQLRRFANPNTFSAETGTALDLDEWHFLMATTNLVDGVKLYIGNNLEVTVPDGDMPFPVPQPGFLRTAGGIAHNEGPTHIGTWSNMALYDEPNLPPDVGDTGITGQVYRTGIVY